MPTPETHKPVHKCYKAEVQDLDAGERTLVAVISTAAIDRDMEVLLPKGAQLENFEANPVVLWAHRSDQPPIGKAEWIKKTAKAVRAKVRFASTDFAGEIFQLFKEGILKAFSVGFDPWGAEHREPDEKDLRAHPEWAGVRRVYSKWELLEFSAVPVPSNPEALAQAVSKGMLVDLANDFGFDSIGRITGKQLTEVDIFPEPEPAPIPKLPVRRALIQTPPSPIVKRRRVIIPVEVEFRLPSDEEMLHCITDELDRLRGRV